ncbi:MAG: DUF1294 domain-containing protein [Clostridiaceae bacterium]|nr:DUF1294 domain-containing protein [Clostridiaceae bacterium]
MNWGLLLGIWLAAASVAAFILCGLDKSFAIRRHRRIPEKTLMGMALLGGSPGLLLGMTVFRHKTRHPKFYIGVPLILLAQLLAVWYFLKLGGKS